MTDSIILKPGETIYKYYNELIWPDIFATCLSIKGAISYLQNEQS